MFPDWMEGLSWRAKRGLLLGGYEVSFTRHFYKPQPLRTLDEIRADILAVEQEAGGLLDDLLKGETHS